MRKFITTLSILCLTAAASFAQTTTIDNHTDCDIEVWVLCYDPGCKFISETPYTVPAHGTIVVPDCPPPNTTSYFVRWLNSVQCGGTAQVGGRCNPPNAVLPDFCHCTPDGAADVTWTPGQLVITP